MYKIIGLLPFLIHLVHKQSIDFERLNKNFDEQVISIERQFVGGENRLFSPPFSPMPAYTTCQIHDYNFELTYIRFEGNVTPYK